MHAMTDPTEPTRRGLVAELNSKAADPTVLEARYGKVWSTTELAIEFEVSAFAAPYVIVKRKSDNKVGSLMFQQAPRYYFAFEEDNRCPLRD